MPGSGFAVIDFETTGLFPGGHDRVVEVAVVHADPHGTITGRWDTLVNPGRDLGPQSIHRIRAADVLDAPTSTRSQANSSSCCAAVSWSRITRASICASSWPN